MLCVTNFGSLNNSAATGRLTFPLQCTIKLCPVLQFFCSFNNSATTGRLTFPLQCTMKLCPVLQFFGSLNNSATKGRLSSPLQCTMKLCPVLQFLVLEQLSSYRTLDLPVTMHYEIMPCVTIFGSLNNSATKGRLTSPLQCTMKLCPVLQFLVP